MANKKNESNETEEVVVRKRHYFVPTESRKSVQADTADEAVQKLKSESGEDKNEEGK